MIRPKVWILFTEAIEEGCAFGLARAVKYEEHPAVREWAEARRDWILEQFEREILNAIDARFDWDEPRINERKGK